MELPWHSGQGYTRQGIGIRTCFGAQGSAESIRPGFLNARGLRRFNSTMAWMSSGDGRFGPGFPLLPDGDSSRWFRFLSILCIFKSVEGRIMKAAR